MSIGAKIIKDSISEDGHRITTFLLTYPRFIHSEVMTHRAFSRNASSSRAIPLKTLIKNTWSNIAYPIEFRANQKGMQAGAPLSAWRQGACKGLWALHSYLSGTIAFLMHKLGAHKQYVNRLLEPTSTITVVLTATDYTNFFALRCHEDAQPEFQALARMMLKEYVTKTPVPLRDGQWHLPFVSIGEQIKYGIEDCIKMSVARCARTSYLNHLKICPSLKEDQVLHNRLLGNIPMHASPAEHQATPFRGQSGNFTGWMQYRKTLDNECITDTDEVLQYVE